MRANARTLYSFPVKLSAGAALVALADIFFYGHPLGWAAGMYGLVILATLSTLQGGLLRDKGSKVLAVLLCGLCLSMEGEPTLLSLGLFAAGIVALLILHKRGRPQDAVLWLRDYQRFFARMFLQWDSDIGTLRKLRKAHKTEQLRVLVRAAYAAVPAVLAVVFALLFTQANPVIARLVDKIDWDFLAGFISPWRGLFWVGSGAVLWTVLRPRFRLPAAPEARWSIPLLEEWFSPGSVVLSLLLFNGIFAIQNALDIAFLWSGKQLPAGISYAAYAHAGAYPLIGTIVLAAAYILVTFSHPRYQTRSALALVYLWIAQNIFLVASSVDRTLHYIEIYSLTYLRLSAMIWMGLVALGLALIVLRIATRKSNMWLVNANTLAALAVLYGCCFVNFDRLIAEYNVSHSYEIDEHGQFLDMNYMKELGPEALPALRRFQHDSRLPESAQEARNLADTEQQDFVDSMKDDWHCWTWRRQLRLDDLPPQSP